MIKISVSNKMSGSSSSGTTPSGRGATTSPKLDAVDSKWYFTSEQLMNSPNKKHGIDGDTELYYRQMTAYLIQDMGQRLLVSQQCINTAIVYMHRFYAFHSFKHFNRDGIASACLLLATKVEDQYRKLEYIINVANKCLNLPILSITHPLYMEQAKDLVFNESVLLQTLGFDVAIDQPHTHVVRTNKLVKAREDLAQTSYTLASNSLHLTSMCLQYKPTVVACVCFYLACKWTRYEIPLSKEGKHWFQYVDETVTMDMLKRLTDEFLATYEKSSVHIMTKLYSIQALAQRPDYYPVNNVPAITTAALGYHPPPRQGSSSNKHYQLKPISAYMQQPHPKQSLLPAGVVYGAGVHDPQLQTRLQPQAQPQPHVQQIFPTQADYTKIRISANLHNVFTRISSQQQPRATKSTASIFNPDYNEKMQNLLMGSNFNDALSSTQNEPYGLKMSSGAKESLKRSERERLDAVKEKENRMLHNAANIPAIAAIGCTNLQQKQQQQQLKPGFTIMKEPNLGGLADASKGAAIKRPNKTIKPENETMLYDTKMCKVDNMPTVMFGIETNPDWVSRLLRESLHSSTLLKKPELIEASSPQPSVELLEPKPVNKTEKPSAEQVTPAEIVDEATIKPEKKKKKKKRKEKGKNKDRSEKKEHKEKKHK